MKIAYFVHDLADAAVHRRVRMMRSFADVTLLGFHRSDTAVLQLDGVDTVDLGRTMDARLGQRALAVLQAVMNSGRWEGCMAGTTVFIARQLEMLVLAAMVRRRIAPTAPLVFECLDIHRLMLTHHPVSIVLRILERHLLRSCSMLVVSSPAFLTSHFAGYGSALPPQLLLENKVLAEDVPSGLLDCIGKLRATVPSEGPPWRIGWFGVIRCRRSLQLLANLVTALPGVVEVIIRGRPRRNVIPGFDQVVKATPGLSFLGEYDRHTELAALYANVHFAWAVDFYEAGRNSDWLLPNRLYEGTLNGAVPLVLASVETGRWLAVRQCGVRLEDTRDQSLERSLLEFFGGLDSTRYSIARTALAQVPISDLLDDKAACDRFGKVLGTLSRRYCT
jgi:succinoglycan biosynthesis protein ExoL